MESPHSGGVLAATNPHRLRDSAKIVRSVRAFVEGIIVQPDKLSLDLRIRKIPALRPGNSTCLIVAGARYEVLQMDLEASMQLVVGGKRLRFVA